MSERTRVTMMWRMPRARATSVAAVLAVLALAGCAGIPTSGSITRGDVVQEADNVPFAPLPSGPQADATQQEILTDFMQAATSPSANYAIARQFLTADAAESWKPNASVLIRQGAATIGTESDTALSYSVSTSADVNSLGVYKESRGAGGTQRLEFQFEQVDGQWRISALADGTVLSMDNFDAVFDSHALYFFDPSYRYLIPDVRWFPSSSVETRIVSALLAGQSSWLQQGATLSAFPTGTQLATAVEVRSGTATVDLSQEVASATDLEKARMQQQLETSLGTVSVSTITMTVEGVPLEVKDPGASSATLTPTLEEPEPLVLKGDQFGFISSGTIAAVPQLSSKIVSVGPTAVTLARGQTSAAVLGAEGAYLITTSSSVPLLADSRSDLVAPSIDTWKFIWSVPSTDASALWAVGTDAVAHQITSTLPADATVVSLDVSRDGGRLLMYLDTDAGPRLKVAAIIRRDGVPAALGELVDLPVAADVPLDATWVDDRSVATLARSAAGATVTVFPIGGPMESLGVADGGIDIVGGNGTSQIRVLTSDSTVLQRRASGWQSTNISADLLGTQQ